MRQRFENTVSALCYSIIFHCCQEGRKTTEFPHNQIVGFVLQQHHRMPDYLKFPLMILTLIFDSWGILTTGSWFHCQPEMIRWQQIQIWKQSPFGMGRDLIRFYESLVIFCWEADVNIHSKSNH